MTNILTKISKWSAILLSISAVVLGVLEANGIDVAGIINELGMPGETIAGFGIVGILGTALTLYAKSSTLNMTNVATTISTETIKYLAADKLQREEQTKQELITQRALKAVERKLNTNNVLLGQTIKYNDIMARKNLASTLLTDADKEEIKAYRLETVKALKSLTLNVNELIDKVGVDNDTI